MPKLRLADSRLAAGSLITPGFGELSFRVESLRLSSSQKSLEFRTKYIFTQTSKSI